MGRPKKNSEMLVGRAGRIAIEQEDRARDARRWQRRKQTIEKFRGSNKDEESKREDIKNQ
jgi:hypothetical protein